MDYSQAMAVAATGIQVQREAWKPERHLFANSGYFYQALNPHTFQPWRPAYNDKVANDWRVATDDLGISPTGSQDSPDI